MKKNRIWAYVILINMLIISLFPINIKAADAKKEKEKKEDAMVIETTMDSSHKFEINGVNVLIDYGFNNKVKSQCFMSVNVVLSSKDKNFNGYFQIGVAENDGGTVYQEKVDIQAGKSATVLFTVPVNTKSGNMECFLLDNDKKTLAKREFGIDVYNNETTMIGMLSDNVDAIKYLSADAQSDVIINLSKDTFPTDYRALESLNLIVINDYDTSQLSATQYSALKNWVYAGGMLFIGTGSNTEKTLKFIDDDFVKIGQGAVRNQEISFSEGTKNDIENNVSKKMVTDEVNIDPQSDVWKTFWKKYNAGQYTRVSDAEKGSDEDLQNIIFDYAEREKSNWIKRNVANLAVANGITVLNSNNNKLIQMVNKSKGKVFISEIDLAIEEEYVEPRGKLCDLISKYSNTNVQKGEKVEKYLSSILQSSRTKMPIASKYIKLLIAYFLILVGSYIFLKKEALRTYIWGVVPILSLVFCGIILLASLTTRISKPLSTFFSVVKLSDGKTAREDLYFNYLIADRAEKKMQIDKDYSIYNKVFASEMSQEDISGNKEYNVYVEKEENNSNLSIKGLSIFSTRNFNAVKSFESKMNMDVTLNGFNDNFSGSITNNVGEDLKYVSIVMPNFVLYIGDLKSGETVKIDDSTAKMSYNSKANVCYAFYNIMGKDKDNATNCVDSGGHVTSIGFARAVEYYMLSNDFPSESSACVLGMSNRSSDLISSIDVESSGMSLFEKDIHVNYTNSKQQTYVADIRNRLNFINGAGDITYDSTEGTWKIDGVGAEAEYSIDPSSKIDALNILSSVNRVYEEEKNQTPVFDGRISLLNINTHQYDLVYSSGDEAKVTNMSEYNNKGTVTIKFETNAEGVSYIPSISVIRSE